MAFKKAALFKTLEVELIWKCSESRIDNPIERVRLTPSGLALLCDNDGDLQSEVFYSGFAFPEKESIAMTSCLVCVNILHDFKSMDSVVMPCLRSPQIGD